jgi:hypothetical protein
MDIKIYKSAYKDQEALTLESDVLKAQFLPHIGSRMCSLIYKPLDLELLTQRDNKEYRMQSYDKDYLKGECSGFDEMFPTINEDYYQEYPWKGIKIPDHGEVWALPWDLSMEEDKIVMQVNGIRFPYKLKKVVSFLDESILRIGYELINPSPFDLDYLWAAHAMFILEEEAEIILPPGVDKIISTMSYSDRLGSYGDEFSWPAFMGKDGKVEKLNIIRPRSFKDSSKYYIRGKMPQGWCALRYPYSSIILALSFPKDTVPYLGILPNEGGWQDLYNIFLEPCTSSFDSINAAKLRGQCSSIPAGSNISWYLNITVSDIRDFSSVDSKGRLV